MRIRILSYRQPALVNPLQYAECGFFYVLSAMTFDEFKKLSSRYSAIPVYRTMMADTITPVSLFLKLRQNGRYPFLLESVEGGEHLARYSFLGRDPYQVFRYEAGRLFLDHVDRETQELEGEYFQKLQELCARHEEPEIPGLPRLTGGAVGYSAYDTVRLIEHLPGQPEDDLELPDAVWSFYDEIYAFDHVKHRVLLIKTVFTDGKEDECRFNEAMTALDRMQDTALREAGGHMDFQLASDHVDSNTTPESFASQVEKARHYITEGDIFQVVLSQRFNMGYEGDRFMLYRALRMVNPSPYLFYLDFQDFALIGSSPEVLVRVEDGQARVLPIAGTRRRGETLEEDRKLEQELSGDPKEVAEHVMLVDLGRNDLSRICVPGSVRMTRNQTVEYYSHVMHIVSEVVGRMDPGRHPIEALMHCFPAGTVSGAPKVRALEIIDELEPTKRGPYAGAVGYIDYSGNMDTCIAIRTMVATDRDIYIQAGAGIVSDSVPENEYQETVNKAEALIQALKLALTMEQEPERHTGNKNKTVTTGAT